jgi:cell division protein FtsB
MQATKQQVEKKNASAPPEPMSLRAQAWTARVWRPTGTVVAIGLALLLTWHVINGQHGLSVWHQMRAEDRSLQKEIGDLQQENQELRKQIEGLQKNPDAIERAAREKLHYARPDEVIYTLPPNDGQATNPGK